jgi:hypothetical protein
LFSGHYSAFGWIEAHPETIHLAANILQRTMPQDYRPKGRDQTPKASICQSSSHEGGQFIERIGPDSLHKQPFEIPAAMCQPENLSCEVRKKKGKGQETKKGGKNER